ncbi:hypothetical protein P3C94_11080 [Pseudomonas aeruginosa]|uniref:hypothetical protein n=1 Tax=Pseudomonas aeruginosa TaxID=287 RepID=UPI000FC40C23|nr:hypothetical protein [Pseudomonas aeruginosa]MCO2936840.1 hypothetical protein [Pseudomonas aeruginosa]RUB44474.1 hypothetical protein IPC1427_27775 [Pseudomonas aeruginosa]RUB74042.1 hypothetical protein IPC1428_14140 [Pseudomonas aeruginosa]HBN8613193.1 hypothetical protein [Pseudomonas aeruginosa]HBN9752084.1 hypothetical protein [Pseudomonas aeruginosa]
MYDIQDRFREVIRHNTSEARRFADLQALTGIPATSWNKTYNRKQKPSAEMIQAVAQTWPEYAFWLATGVTDARSGHISCRDGDSRHFYPERSCAPRHLAKPYFKQMIEMFRRLYGDKDPYPTEVMEREAETELVRLELARESEDQALRAADSTLKALRRCEAAEQAAREHEEPLVTPLGQASLNPRER